MAEIKTFIVLGMHRSATSLIAKALATEIDMGARFEPAIDNPQGHWENWDFVNLNDRILASAGGSWDNPPSRKDILAQRVIFEKEISKLVNSFNKKGKNWGFKDPRTALTIELYAPYLKNPHYIAVFREPKNVALSLLKRNQIPEEDGIKLAQEYNKRIKDFLCSL